MTQLMHSLPDGNYVALSPYVRPPGVLRRNIGDGFILDSAAKLIGSRPAAIFSSRTGLTEGMLERINSSKLLIAIGANSLKDTFKLAPNFDLQILDRIKVPVVLMGIGHVGVVELARGLTPQSCDILRELLRRFPFASVRCEASRDYVVQSLPDMADSILMTSCPVAHSVDGIDFHFRQKETYEQLVVTITDRANVEDQLPWLAQAKQSLPAKRAILALHQDEGNSSLVAFAKNQGFEVFLEEDYEPYLALYAQTDIHFGNRVHAHLKCLSHGIRTFLAPFDLRQVYFSQSLDFPLIDRLPSIETDRYDFARATMRIQAAQNTMKRFVAAVRELLP